MMANGACEYHGAARRKRGGRDVRIGYHAGRGQRWERTLSTSGRILLVGFGNMGQALVRGWLDSGRAAASVRVVEPVASARSIARDLGVDAHDSVAALK